MPTVAAEPQSEKAISQKKDVIEIIGAREHNLKNVSLEIPRNELVVITGISGSGKSSLAFDTLYAEGQRRYMESFSAYARSFIGDMERPDVDKINGLSPVIAIEQKTTSKNPRSTVGTVTEIYDFLRLLFARAGIAYSYITGNPMVKQSEDQIFDQIFSYYDGQPLTILSPVVKGRKGHYRELFQQIRKMGYARVRVDGELVELEAKMQVDRYKTHDIEIVIDRVVVKKDQAKRIRDSVQTALKQGNGVIMLLKADDTLDYFSKNLMDPESGIAYDDPAPNSFSFNSPYGACQECNGLGVVEQISKESIIPNVDLSISRGGIVPLGEYRDIWIFKKVEAILKRNKVNLSTPIKKIPEEVIDIILY
ncbi:MAG: excinuclease ABC subunit A, partial [Cyclobacteriaceae bacterium]